MSSFFTWVKQELCFFFENKRICGRGRALFRTGQMNAVARAFLVPSTPLFSKGIQGATQREIDREIEMVVVLYTKNNGKNTLKKVNVCLWNESRF
jgi:hypothetical protein